MKKIFFLFLTFVLFLVFTKVGHASDSPFDIRISSTYNLKENGKTVADHEVSVRNITTEQFADSLDITLTDINYDTVTAYENGVKLAVSTVSTSPPVYRIVFIDKVVGRDQVRKFTVQTEDHISMKKAGEVWEVSLPTIQGDFTKKRVFIRASVALGELATARPEPTQITTDTIVFESMGDHDIFLVFGKFQVLSFDLGFDIENTSSLSKEVEIPVPPDSSYQRVHLQSMNPLPTNMRLDDDGNWLASYRLTANQKLHVIARGTVQVYESPIHFLRKPINLDKNKEKGAFWETDDPSIIQIAASLPDARAVYDYVVDHLTYDYDRAKTNGNRLGAREALLEPSQSLCQEFSDLFVTLMRAKGIPARVVNGYAVIDNAQLTPLSQKGDVLHAWPEYWDEEKGLWTAADPTWGKTSGNDYFSRMDFKRIAFVMHGQSADLPLPPGSYKFEGSESKLVSVSIGTWNQDTNQVKVSIDDVTRLPLFALSFTASAANIGATAFYNQRVTILTDKSVVSDTVIPVLLPFSQYVYPIKIRAGVLGNSLPESIQVVSDESKKQVEINKSVVTLTQLPVIFLILAIAAITIVLVVPRHRKLKLPKLFLKK